jgi:hypothetical protein
METLSTKRPSSLDKKLRIASNSSSIVIAAKTQEGRALAEMAIDLDRILNTLRLKVITHIPLEAAQNCLSEASSFISKMEDALRGLNPMATLDRFSTYNSTETKMLLVKQGYCFVSIPRTDEGKRVMEVIQALDPAILHLRTTCSDLNALQTRIMGLKKLIRDFNSLLEKLCSVTGSDRKYMTTVKVFLNA